MRKEGIVSSKLKLNKNILRKQILKEVYYLNECRKKEFEILQIINKYEKKGHDRTELINEVVGGIFGPVLGPFLSGLGITTQGLAGAGEGSFGDRLVNYFKHKGADIVLEKFGIGPDNPMGNVLKGVITNMSSEDLAILFSKNNPECNTPESPANIIADTILGGVTHGTIETLAEQGIDAVFGQVGNDFRKSKFGEPIFIDAKTALSDKIENEIIPQTKEKIVVEICNFSLEDVLDNSREEIASSFNLQDMISGLGDKAQGAGKDLMSYFQDDTSE